MACRSMAGADVETKRGWKRCAGSSTAQSVQGWTCREKKAIPVDNNPMLPLALQVVLRHTHMPAGATHKKIHSTPTRTAPGACWQWTLSIHYKGTCGTYVCVRPLPLLAIAVGTLTQMQQTNVHGMQLGPNIPQAAGGGHCPAFHFKPPQGVGSGGGAGRFA